MFIFTCNQRNLTFENQQIAEKLRSAEVLPRTLEVCIVAPEFICGLNPAQINTSYLYEVSEENKYVK